MQVDVQEVGAPRVDNCVLWQVLAAVTMPTNHDCVRFVCATRGHAVPVQVPLEMLQGLPATGCDFAVTSLATMNANVLGPKNAFARFLTARQPVLIRGGAAESAAFKKWSPDFLADAFEDRQFTTGSTLSVRGRFLGACVAHTQPCTASSQSQAVCAAVRMCSPGSILGCCSQRCAVLHAC